MDRLELMFSMQRAFMERLRQRDEDFPQKWPLDMLTKSAQKVCRELTWKAQHELAEAVAELKNAKEHRVTDVKEFDNESFVEELVDAWKYMQEVLILMGVTPEKFFEVYAKKDAIINRRIDENY